MTDADFSNATIFIYKGEEYTAEPSYNNCDGCAFDELEQFNGCYNNKRPFCSGHLRADKRNIIWVKKND